MEMEMDSEKAKQARRKTLYIWWCISDRQTLWLRFNSFLLVMVQSEAVTEMCYLISSCLSLSFTPLPLSLTHSDTILSCFPVIKRHKEKQTFLKQDKFTCEAKLSDELVFRKHILIFSLLKKVTEEFVLL